MRGDLLKLIIIEMETLLDLMTHQRNFWKTAKEKLRKKQIAFTFEYAIWV